MNASPVFRAVRQSLIQNIALSPMEIPRPTPKLAAGSEDDTTRNPAK